MATVGRYPLPTRCRTAKNRDCPSASLATGTYTYRTKGMYPLEGEIVTVSPDKDGAKVVIELPDIRDEKRYNYQSDLYAATPIVVNIPK